ncbi:MAG: dimethylsulfonioproprionate lyase family protein [Rhodovibrionaceae bacterium]
MASSDSTGHGEVSSPAAALLREAHALTERLLPPELQGLAAALPKAPPARSLAARSLPVLAWCGGLEAAASTDTRRLTALLSAQAASLAWGQTYTAEDISQAFQERYGWCELLGLRGHFASAEIALGVLMLGPETVYPLHSHAAEEVYIVLSGQAAWRKGKAEEGLLPAASVVHHPSWIPHAMRTASEPLLALYLWRGGELTQKSRLT